MINNKQPEPPVDFAGAARIFFRQTQKLIDTVAELERKEIEQIVQRHRNEHKWRAEQMAGAAKDLELVKAECCEVILEDIRTKGSWANLPATPTISPATTQSPDLARAAEEIVEMIEAEREPHPEWSKNARRKYRDKAVDIISRYLGPTAAVLDHEHDFKAWAGAEGLLCWCGAVEKAGVIVKHGERSRVTTVIAEEIADRWSKHELPASAGIHSSPTLQLRALVEYVTSRHLGSAAVPEPHCWHCGVLLESPPRLRCSECPDECDEENCGAFGCGPCGPTPTEDNK